VKLSRKDKDGKTKTIKVDVKAILQEGKMEYDIPLEDGDFIFVPRVWIRV
jgi:hypothetical protein